MKKIVNIKNNNNNTGFYPAFLGEDLGFADTINITYPEIHEMYVHQRSKFWTESEISLSQDRLDLLDMPQEQRDVMLLNLLAQWLLDSTAARSIMATFGPFITNNEVFNLLTVQNFFEGIHAAQYSEIIKNCFTYSNDALEQAKSDVMVAYRSKIIGEVFHETNQLGAKYTQGLVTDKSLLRRQILKNMAVLYGLEAISFMASFACTFALTQTGKCQGIDKAVGLITSDEVSHALGDKLIFEVLLKKEEGYREEFDKCKHELQDIFDEIVKQEFGWSEYIFSDGRKVLGLNEDVLKEYVRFIAKPCFDYLGLKWAHGDVPKSNPLPYMNQYTDPDGVQTAPQELEVNNYRIAQIDNDLTDVEFDF